MDPNRFGVDDKFWYRHTASHKKVAKKISGGQHKKKRPRKLSLDMNFIGKIVTKMGEWPVPTD